MIEIRVEYSVFLPISRDTPPFWQPPPLPKQKSTTLFQLIFKTSYTPSHFVKKKGGGGGYQLYFPSHPFIGNDSMCSSTLVFGYFHVALASVSGIKVPCSLMQVLLLSDINHSNQTQSYPVYTKFCYLEKMYLRIPHQ